MSGRTRRRTARVDFSSLVAPEDVETPDSDSDYQGNGHDPMEEELASEDDLDVAMDSSPDSDREDSRANLVEETVIKVEHDTRPQSNRRSTSRATETPHISRIENLRDRLVLFYGDSNEELIRAIKLRHKWSDALFSVSPSQLDLTEEVSAKPLVSNSFLSTLSRSGSVSRRSGSSIRVDDTLLDPSSQRRSQTVSVLNAGSGISVLDFNHAGTLLAIGLLPAQEPPVDASSFRPELAPKSSSQDESQSLIHLYEVDGSKLEPFASVEGTHGPIVDLKWAPHASALAAVFADGAVGVLDPAERGAFTLKLNALPPVGSGKATCLAWRAASLVVGYADGLVAEFDTADELTPSYVAQVHDSVVTSIVCGSPNMLHLILTTGVDGNLKITDTRDLRVIKRAPRLKHFAAASAYLPLVDSFVCLEDANTAKLVPTRHPHVQMALTSVTRHDAGVSALAASQCHPLLLSGGHDGALHVTNPLRRAMATRRKRDLQLDCTLWRLECSHKTSDFRFVELLSVDALNTKRESSNTIPLYPASVAVTSIAWAPRSTWYAAGTASGLVRLENVDG